LESIHHWLNDVFQFSHSKSIWTLFQKSLKIKHLIFLKLMHFEPNDYDIENCIRELIEWVSNFTKARWKYGWCKIHEEGWF
jgi:hypothetical protein